MNIEIDGLDGLFEKLGEISKSVDAAVRMGVEKGGKEIQAQCIAECPIGETDELHESIVQEVSGGDGRYTSEIGPTADHGVYVEFGTGIHAKNGAGRQTPWHYQDKNGEWHTTRGQPPQPFMETGFNAGKDEAIEALMGEIRKVIK